uniref:Magnetosome protein Mad21 n=1 Tax=delta proteobacterium ML-1 TaxID=947513 RepID=U5IGN4_9DELT|nr:magnetosome protein Mad21 [delta proteobacterium ML-1]
MHGMTHEDLLRDPDVAALLERREELDCTHRELVRSIEELRSEHVALSERLRLLNREQAVARHDRNGLRNETASLKTRLQTLTEQMRAGGPEYMARKETLRKLTEKRRAMRERVDELDQECVAIGSRVTALEMDLIQAQEQLGSLEEQKQAIVDEISGRLSNTSLDRDEVEKHLNEVALEFRDAVTRRDEVLEEHGQVSEAMAAVGAEVKDYAERIDVLERMRALDQELRKLTKRAEGERRETGQAEQNLSEARAALALSQEMLAERVEKTEALERRSTEIQTLVGSYQAAKSAMEAKEESLRLARESLAGFEKELREILVVLPLVGSDVRALRQGLERVARGG